ncbi:MAG: hypothetical protein MUF09_02905 [Candidatus Nanopelagicales bacterium]|nr:hypothetical protein [Candidatus Nanopelagicales bacterium]
MNRNGLAAALLVVAAVGSVVLVAQQAVMPSPRATSEEACLALADLQDVLEQSSLSDQAVLRARAARLADLLAGPSAQEAPSGSTAVARAIVAVLDDPRARVSDLEAAIAAIAWDCRS